MEEQGNGDGGAPAGYVYLSEDGGAEGSSPPTGSPASVSAAAVAAAVSEPSSDSDSDPEGWEPLREEGAERDQAFHPPQTASYGVYGSSNGHLADGDASADGIWRATFNDTDGDASALDPGHSGPNRRGPPELKIEGVPAAEDAHALAHGPDPAPADIGLDSDVVAAVKAAMAGVALEYAPPWAAAVSEGEWRRALRERLEGRRGGGGRAQGLMLPADKRVMERLFEAR